MLRTIALALALCLTLAAPRAESAPRRFNAGDGFSAFGVGASLGFAGSLVGARLGACSSCDLPNYDSGASLGAGAFAAAFAATGVTLYGSAADLDGSGWAALLGATLGSLTVTLPMALADRAGDGQRLATVVLLAPAAAALGATLGYALTTSTPDDDAVPAGALLDIRPSRAPRLGIPALAFAPDPAGDWSVALTLASARF
ncbi:MAG: hypothetical protein H6745_15940 [Deltaproteobacteria bacterium]|nr:hypothetical protein [Deltaproteobacteria bacterium]